MPGRELQPQRRTGEIDVDDAASLVGAILGRDLLAQHAIGQQDLIGEPGLLQHGAEARLGLVHIGQVRHQGFDRRGPSRREIGRDGGETLLLARHEDETRAGTSTAAAERRGDGRGGAEDENAPMRNRGALPNPRVSTDGARVRSRHRRRIVHAVPPVTRRQKLDEMAGSRRASTSRQRGNPARN